MQWLEPTVKRLRPQEPFPKPRRAAKGFTSPEEEQKWSQLRSYEVKRPSVKPVPMPCFKAMSFSEEVQELLESLKATEESQRQVEAGEISGSSCMEAILPFTGLSSFGSCFV